MIKVALTLLGLLLAALAALVATACTVRPSPRLLLEPIPTPTSTHVSRFLTAEQLRDAAVARGYSCADWTQVSPTDDDQWATGGLCADDFFRLYADPVALQADLYRWTEVHPASRHLVYGTDWMITLRDPNQARALAEGLAANLSLAR